jgi:diguanylate cyclase (GGDEF)-like protein/PAS domain S-box-containing protein
MVSDAVVILPAFAASGAVLAVFAVLACARRGARAEATGRSIAEARAHVVATRTGLCSFEVDVARRRLHWSPEMCELHGVDVDTFDGTFAAARALVAAADDAERFELGLAQLVLHGEASFTYRTRRPDGELRWIEAWASEFDLPDPPGRRAIGVAHDVTERERAGAELSHLSRHDALTGLPNRSAFIGRLERMLDEPRPGALLLLDLDGFKEINDALGHGIGDLVLIELATRLRTCIGRDDVLGRLGGDEFGVLLHDVDDVAPALAVAQCVLEKLSEPVRLEPMALHVSGSVGIARWPLHGTSASMVLKHADVAMYKAKDRANCAVVYEPDHQDDRAWKLALVAELRAALDRGDLDVHYQPIVELPTNRVVGLEALARWRRPTGDIGPVVFVPLAEQFGLISDLTLLIMRKAMAEARRWQSDGTALRVSINISPRVLSRPTFADDVKAVLRDAGLPPERLILEITETALAEPTGVLMAALQDLRAMGVGIALDDFGAGYSCLGTLTELPVDILKIDRSFLSRLPAPNAIGVVRAIIEMARHLGIETVAEGVEGEAAATLLRDLGCGFAQGFHFGRPTPVVDLRSLGESDHFGIAPASS